MSILVTGSTGRIGSQVVKQLAEHGASVRALARKPEFAKFPQGVEAVGGDLLDADAVRKALVGVKTLFLLASNTQDELTQAVNTLGLAREAGVQGIVYLSVTRSDQYTDVSHFTAKHAVERMIEQMDLPATILRPAYFIKNNVTLKDPLTKAGLYVAPVGDKGVSMVDVRDIVEGAVVELLRRDKSTTALPSETYELGGPDALTGNTLAGVWADVLGREVRHAGNDLDTFEDAVKARAPAWLAYDLRAMKRRYQTDGAVASPAETERLTALLGHPPRSYRDFARETASGWSS